MRISVNKLRKQLPLYINFLYSDHKLAAMGEKRREELIKLFGVPQFTKKYLKMKHE